MVELDVRTFETPDETIDAEKAHAKQVSVGGRSVWQYTFEPGWRYTEHFEPELCAAPHAGYIAAGTLGVLMEDGTEAEAGPGAVMTIAPGHDAWTVGDEACVYIDFAESLEP